MALKKCTKNKKSEFTTNIKFIFKFVVIESEVNSDVYNFNQHLEIKRILDAATKEIYIDKTYVDFKNTKFNKTFITEKQWNNLCHLLYKTSFGTKITKLEHDALIESYNIMIISYLYQFLVDLGYDIDNILLDVKDGSKFMLEYHKDETSEYDNYVG